MVQQFAVEQIAQKSIHDALKDEVAEAKQRLDKASADFDEVSDETRAELASEDGSLRIVNASRDYARARHDLMTALRRLNAFILEGTVPGDLGSN